jgi:hypothetical protein
LPSTVCVALVSPMYVIFIRSSFFDGPLLNPYGLVLADLLRLLWQYPFEMGKFIEHMRELH